MVTANPLPDFLVERYRGWHATYYSEHEAEFHRLADEGKTPPAMLISCCDSRVQITSIFGADQGDFFVHRNIANLVPPYNPEGVHHGTPAAVEYAVRFLRVPHIVVIGHSHCGGAQGCADMCSGSAPEFEDKESLIGRWIDLLRPGYERVKHIDDPGERATALEHQTVVVSLQNLVTYPFVQAAIDAGQLQLHGVWTDISDGRLLQYDAETGKFGTI